jgi:hypothetical protein
MALKLYGPHTTRFLPVDSLEVRETPLHVPREQPLPQRQCNVCVLAGGTVLTCVNTKVDTSLEHLL